MARQLEIMVLDDEAIVGARLQPSLEKAGYAVESFIDSRQALKRLQEKRFDIVVTDLKMANVDGMEIHRFAKQRWPDTVVVIITGFATVETAREALQSGVFDFIAKPFKISHLREVIEKAASSIEQAARKEPGS
ncbi:MAG: response regulator [Candidatus Abyssobacteria bacterium SURF_5]|uniref:Response regulator n=1 Tax=Abyssobacteria bacterium (strain SURF_5) TaxID=2093360 RepID=A0A3A4NSV0_ABYX5|nr:MAG: response regulator [Candidatus Abyssubacteria bacterium SURF_5]